ncbi:hypothetical protein [Paraburkholderia sp.]|uniref:hypothetical protein n=1 Tax=Paraburkholderia sp. TaxID=1926495 RepID=UPI0025EAA90D|nr:hypothetical protein [Paraburkholderia sp.]
MPQGLKPRAIASRVRLRASPQFIARAFLFPDYLKSLAGYAALRRPEKHDFKR